jgi:transposase InsO family protein
MSPRLSTDVVRRAMEGLEDVEFATLEWVAWYNGSRLLEPLGYDPPAEFGKPGAVQEADTDDLGR